MPTDEFDDELSPTRRNLWNENHGNLLLAVSGVIFSLGAVVLLYQQYRESTRPVRFPSGDAIQTPGEITNVKDAAPNELAVAIKVTGASNANGTMMIAVYDAELNNFTEPALKASRTIYNGESEWKIPLTQLPKRFAVAAYHDEDGNESLSRLPLGIPAEPYGFSNNARGVVGKPSFDDAIIERPEKGGEIEILIQ